MIAFVQTDGGIIVNLAHVVRIEPRHNAIQFVTEDDLRGEVYHIGGSAAASVDFDTSAEMLTAHRRLVARISAGDRYIDPRVSNPR